MRTLKVLLGVGVGVGLLATCTGWVLFRQPLAGTGDVYIGPETEKFIRFVQEQFGVGRSAAIDFMHRAGREQNARIIDRFNLPAGALVDFIEVDGSRPGATSARFLGTGRVFPALSEEGLAFWRIFERAALRHGWDKAYRAMAELRRRGIVIAPAWFGAGTSTATGAVRLVNTAATQATSIRVAVILARFPAWRDQSPQSDGRTQSYAAGRHYAPDDTGRLRNVEGLGPNYIDWYIDSPGGALLPDGGIPVGTQVQWDDEHPERAPQSYDGPTPLAAQEYWYKRLFDLNFPGSGSGEPNWPASLHNYYWENSHGKIDITGQRTDVYGWIESHHILDRLPYPQGPDPVYMIQPGTPIIRPSDEIVAADGVDRPILRASLTDQKLTILYKQEYLTGSPPMPRLFAYQQDVDGSTSGNQPGWVEIQIGAAGATNVIPDPYDRRRWTYVKVSWKFTDQADPTKTIDYKVWPGQDWRVQNLGYTWQRGERGYMPQDQGCGALPNTLFTRNDVLGSAPGNRFKSFDYYCHDHFVNTSRGPYQIEHIYHGSYVDDIGGDSEPVSARKPRAFPFDCGMPQALGGSDRPQLGFFHYPNNDNQGGHSAGEMRADVNLAMADLGISLSGPYDRIMYVFAGPGLGEGGGSAGNWGTIIAHAGGNMITVGEDAAMTIVAHELGHTLGMGDLYDMDLYTNVLSGTPPNPLFFECNGLGPYSVMAHGVRVDAFHLMKLGWVDKVVSLTEDRPNAEIPAIEGVLREPIIYKLPANPYYLVDGTAPDAWQEYFLVEYRSKSGGAYFGDPSTPGVYIYHVDERAPQTVEQVLAVAMEQADGKFELENNLVRAMNDYPQAQVGPGTTGTDPFGVPESRGGADNFNFCQWDFQIDDWLAGNSNPPTAPTSYSHGLLGRDSNGRPYIIGGTDTDSFVRVLNINVPPNSPIAYADIYVRPREIVVTGEDAWKDLVNGDGDPTNDPAWQGLQNVPVLKLTLENQRNTGPGDYQHMSTGDVTVQHIRVVESGSSPNDTDVALAKIWADSDNDGAFDPTKDTLLSTATFNNQVALFAALNYNVPLGQSRVLFITYDFSETAQINPKVTVAADLPEPRYVWPEPPGTVQTRARTAAQFQFGGPRFPIQSDVHYVIEGTDTVFISASSLAPTEVHPNDQLIPVLRAILSVDRDRAIVRRLRMVCRPAAGASDPQRDVARATLWLDVDANGTVEPGSDTRLADAVFSNKQMVLFDGLNLTVAAGQSIHLIATVDIAENATIGNWLELEMPTWYDDNGTPSNPADDTYYVELVDEDGAGNTYYEDPNNPGVIRDVAHGADPATWKIVAGLDVVDTSGAPWKSIDFRVTPPQKPQLTNASLVPPSGDKSNVFTFRVTYTSPAGIAPAFVRLVYRNLGWNGSRANQVLTMREVDPADRNVTDGKDYWIQITGLPDWGIYKHYYWASDGYTEVWYYDPDGPGQGQPEGYYTSPDSTGPRQADVDPALTDWLEGPVLGMPSSIRFADAAWNDANTYEEGRVTDPATAARVYVEVRDPDENVDRTNPDTLIVTVSCDDGSDSETITLTETGPDTATFRGSIPTIGRSGAADDGWLNAIAGSAGLGITAVYKDKDDLPQPGDIDTSRTSATVVDTTPPAPVAPITARSGVQGRTIDVDWSGYDEAGQIDVAGYRVYCETSDYNSVAGLTPVQTLTAGTRTCTITGLQPDTDYFIAVTAVDEVPNENTSVVTVRVHTVDSQPPVLISRSPAPNATGIALDARTITARVRDTGTGINTSDPDAVQMTVTADDGTGARTVSGSLTVTGGGAAGTAPVDITWTADQDWRWNDVVTVDLKVYDRAGNELHATWRFSVYTDKSPPALVAGTPTPGDGQTNVPLDAQIVCEVQDQADRGMPASNLDLSSLSFQVTVTNRGNQTFQQTFTNADSNPNGPFTVTVIDAGHILITYTHAAGWTWNDVVAVDLTIADNAGNQLRHTWTFQVIEDLAPPYVQARSPDDGQRQVSLDAPIVITMADNVSGVDTQSVQVEIRVENRGAERIPWTDITQDPNYTASWSVDYTQGTLRYQPADGWLYNDVVSVRVRATDRAGNAMTDWAQWSFSVLEDTDDLAIIDPSPASGATNVPRNTNISFRVIDSVSGVDRATIGLQIDGQAVNFSDLQISGDEHDYTVVYDPPANFDYGQTVQCRATAKDVAGNSTELVWTFTTEGDFNPPIITAVAPLPDATGVPIGSTVSVRIADPETGVDQQSVLISLTAGSNPIDGKLAVSAENGSVLAVFTPD
ncbi:MAG: Ig-like domain-containing protein, partial [Armatimonadetes bacterium]|nr:Ig-like domain-containing protein [Armatimonadota bacterium]